jgi:hypothetical protein
MTIVQQSIMFVADRQVFEAMLCFPEKRRKPYDNLPSIVATIAIAVSSPVRHDPKIVHGIPIFPAIVLNRSRPGQRLCL